MRPLSALLVQPHDFEGPLALVEELKLDDHCVAKSDRDECRHARRHPAPLSKPMLRCGREEGSRTKHPPRCLEATQATPPSRTPARWTAPDPTVGGHTAETAARRIGVADNYGEAFVPATRPGSDPLAGHSRGRPPPLPRSGRWMSASTRAPAPTGRTLSGCRFVAAPASSRSRAPASASKQVRPRRCPRCARWRRPHRRAGCGWPCATRDRAPWAWHRPAGWR